MGLVLTSPTRLHLDFSDEVIDSVRQKLTFKDKAAQFAYTRFKHNRWYADRHGPEAYHEELERLKAETSVELLFEDDRGLYTYSGLRDYLKPILGDTSIEVRYPEEGILGYQTKTKKIRSYQEKIVQNLMAVRHGSVESATGTGKTLCIQELIKRHGLRATVVTPSASIARQMFREFKKVFGLRLVGLYGDGRHDLGKQVTVCIAASLTRIENGSKEYKFFIGTEVLVFDESHTIPSETFKKVCLGVLASAPYRYFLSATQMRNDGKDLLLESLIGPMVFEYSLRQGVEEGYLSKPEFHVYRVPTDTNFYSDDTLEMMRAHVYGNKILHRKAAELANNFVRLLGYQVLIMIENVPQFNLLHPYLLHEAWFAHGGLTAQHKLTVDKKYHRVDTEKLVDDFNDKKFPVLIGTGCIGVGTDFQGVDVIIYLQGGKSEIKISQAVGRGTRRPEGKTKFLFVDFDVEVECRALREQFKARCEIYENLYPGALIRE